MICLQMLVQSRAKLETDQAWNMKVYYKQNCVRIHPHRKHCNGWYNYISTLCHYGNRFYMADGEIYEIWESVRHGSVLLKGDPVELIESKKKMLIQYLFPKQSPKLWKWYLVGYSPCLSKVLLEMSNQCKKCWDDGHYGDSVGNRAAGCRLQGGVEK